MTLRELIAKLESATEGSRELDAEIARHLGWKAAAFATALWWPPGHQNPAHLPRYTISIDAALTALPEGAEYSISTLYCLADVELPLNGGDRLPEKVRRRDGNVPLALITAILRARKE